MLKIVRFVFNAFGENTYLTIDAATNQAAVIDPGMVSTAEQDALDKYIRQNDIKLTQIILTHAHIDHILGAGYVKDKYGAVIKAHPADGFIAQSANLQAQRFGMKNSIDPVSFDIELKDGDEIQIGESSLAVIHLPGHSPGGIVLYDRDDNVAFTGDSIFEGSIGRTDLEGGDYHTLVKALKDKVLTLPGDTILLPGHGEPTNVNNEKATNPYLK